MKKKEPFLELKECYLYSNQEFLESDSHSYFSMAILKLV